MIKLIKLTKFAEPSILTKLTKTELIDQKDPMYWNDQLDQID